MSLLSGTEDVFESEEKIEVIAVTRYAEKTLGKITDVLPEKTLRQTKTQLLITEN